MIVNAWMSVQVKGEDIQLTPSYKAPGWCKGEVAHGTLHCSRDYEFFFMAYNSHAYEVETGSGRNNGIRRCIFI